MANTLVEDRNKTPVDACTECVQAHRPAPNTCCLGNPEMADCGRLCADCAAICRCA